MTVCERETSSYQSQSNIVFVTYEQSMCLGAGKSPFPNRVTVVKYPSIFLLNLH